MIVERNALRLAMVQVCRFMQRQPARRLSLDELDQQWITAGIRRADLTVALRELQRRHVIAELQTGPSRVLTLTNASAQEYAKLKGNWFRQLADWLALMRMKFRSLDVRGAQPGLRRRRKADRLVAPRVEDPD